MTDTVFLFGSHLSKGMFKAVRTEDRVIAEALCPTPLCCNLTINDTFEKMFLLDTVAPTGAYILFLDKGDDSAEARFTVIFVLEFTQRAIFASLS